MPYGMSDADYAREVDRKRAAGIPLTSSFDQAAYERGKASMQSSSSSTSGTSTSKSSGSSSSGGSGGSVPVRSTLEGLGYTIDYDPNTGQIVVTDPRSGVSGTIYPGSYSVTGGTAYINPSYIQSWLSGTPTGKSTSTPYNPAPVTPYNTVPVTQLISMIGDQFRNVEYPYQQLLEQLLKQVPTYQQKPWEDVLKQAQEYADLLIDPQVSALQRSLEQGKQAYEAQREAVEAAYTGVPESLSRLMEKARENAIRTAIARGGGRTGAVEWLTKEQQEPIIESATRLEAEKAAKLTDIAEKLALLETQGSTYLSELEEQRGRLAEQQAKALQELDYANATGDWQRAFAATQTLANLATAAEQNANAMMVALLPYLSPTYAEEEAARRDMTSILGVTPDIGTLTGGVDYTAAPAIPSMSPEVKAYLDRAYTGGAEGYIASQRKRYREALAKGDYELARRLQEDAERVGYTL